MSSRLRIVVAGLLGQYPIGGVAWDYLQYVVGLARLGHDVFYVEDSGQWPYDPVEGGSGRNAERNARHVREVLTRFGLGDRWAFRFPGGRLPCGTQMEPVWYGLADAMREEVLGSADLLINVSSGIGDPAPYRVAPPRTPRTGRGRSRGPAKYVLLISVDGLSFDMFRRQPEIESSRRLNPAADTKFSAGRQHHGRGRTAGNRERRKVKGDRFFLKIQEDGSGPQGVAGPFSVECA